LSTIHLRMNSGLDLPLDTIATFISQEGGVVSILIVFYNSTIKFKVKRHTSNVYLVYIQ